MEEKIGLTRALELLGMAVATRGDAFVYQDKEHWADRIGCINVPFTDELGGEGGVGCGPDGWPGEGSPKRLTGCIVGTALALGGVPVHKHPTGPVWTFRDHLTDNAHDMLRIAQLAQDQGVSWGTARDLAVAWVEALRRRLDRAGVPMGD